MGAPVQLAPKQVQTTGITHLVRLNDEGSLYQENFIENEVAETRPGDQILIETDDQLRSRRGGNQESDPQRDKTGPSSYVWVRASKFNKVQLPPKSYIRQDMFEDVLIDEKKKTKKERLRAEDARGSLLLSYDIPVNGPAYLIDASHRGDMYQLRAAVAVANHPVIIYNFKGENDLTNYLSNAPDVQIYKLDYNPALPKHEDFASGRIYRSLEVLSESDATGKVVAAPGKAKRIQQSMRTVPEECIPFIDYAVDEIFNGMPAQCALMMYRDSGQTNLVYPELDSGEALPTLALMMRRKGYEPVLCGAPNSQGFANIGAYWNALDQIPSSAGIEVPIDNPKIFKRDIEAEFMHRAYAKGKFKIVVGFRSGALDLFTLLGIPTISIGLKGLVGEDRHSKYVGDDTWKRTNIQYDNPRSKDTKMMSGRGDSSLYMSPYWKMRSKDKTLDQTIFPDTADAPADFHESDLPTIDKGLDIGIAKSKGKTGLHSVVTRELDLGRIKLDNIKAPPADVRRVFEPLSENAQHVLSVLKSALPKRVLLPDSKDEEAVQRLFSMSSAAFFAAYKELRSQKFASHDKDGPFLL